MGPSSPQPGDVNTLGLIVLCPRVAALLLCLWCSRISLSCAVVWFSQVFSPSLKVLGFAASLKSSFCFSFQGAGILTVCIPVLDSTFFAWNGQILSEDNLRMISLVTSYSNPILQFDSNELEDTTSVSSSLNSSKSPRYVDRNF